MEILGRFVLEETKSNAARSPIVGVIEVEEFDEAIGRIFCWM